MNDWFGSHPESIAFQHADLGVLGVTAKQCSEAVQFVNADLHVWSGSDAVARTLIVAGLPFSVAGHILLLPGVRTVAASSYRWIAANRHRFRGDPIPG